MSWQALLEVNKPGRDVAKEQRRTRFLNRLRHERDGQGSPSYNHAISANSRPPTLKTFAITR